MTVEKGLVYILDMESGLTDALVRRVVDMEQHFIFRRWDMNIDAAAELDTYKGQLRGLIVSGSGKNINSEKVPPPQIPTAFMAANIPILGICYGMQFMAHVMGVPIIRCWDEQDPNKRSKKTAKTDKGELGPVLFRRTADSADSPIFAGLGRQFPVWMKHNWMLGGIPEGWTLLGRTDRCPIAAVSQGDRYAVQFHPEPHNSLFGRVIIHNFISRVCKLETPYF